MSTLSRPKSMFLGRGSNGARMTPEEFDAVEDYDECYRYELIHGVVIVSPLPKETQVSPNDELGHLLRSYAEHHEHGKCLDETLPERYIRTADSRRIADRVVWVGLGRRPEPTTDVPAIAVEFVSKRRRDRQRDYVEKRREYAAVGVQEYWVIDRFARTLTVYRPAQPEVVVPESQNYETPLLPGFVLPIGHLLKLADRWAK